MDRINQLIEKYFQGKTTLQEENELKNYFLSGNVSLEHEKYRSMFETFNLELMETIPIRTKKNFPLQRNVRKIRLLSISISGIAAAFILTFWLLGTYPSEDFAVIKGKRIDNKEFAQQYTLNKFNKLHNLLAKSMQSMDDINKVRNSLKSVQKIKETRERINEIKTKLQY